MSRGSPSLSQALRQRPFLVCAGVLIAATVFAGPVARHMRVVLRKDPVPLRKPLGELDKTALGEYRFEGAIIIPETTLGPLGTTDYIDWRFTDTTVSRRRDPLGSVQCFVTFYTGKPDLVPHTPDACYLGHGYRMREADNLEFAIRGPNLRPLEVPVRAISFVKSSVFGQATPTVVYTFHCNGKFVNTRTQVRAQLADPFDKGAYYCKVEVTFGAPKSRPRHPDRQESIAAAEKFLERLLPVLLEEHLPDWEAVRQGGPPA